VLRYGKTLGCELHGNVASYFLVFFFFSFVFDKSSFSWHFFKTENSNYLFQKVALKFHSCRKRKYHKCDTLYIFLEADFKLTCDGRTCCHGNGPRERKMTHIGN
jgi:hypothetical protein